MASSTNIRSRYQRRSTSSAQSVQGNVPVQDASGNTAPRLTPAFPIARGSPFFRHLHVHRAAPAPQAIAGHAGPDVLRRSGTLPSTQGRSNEVNGQDVSGLNDVASSTPSLGNTTEEDEDIVLRIPEPQPAQHLGATSQSTHGQVHSPVRADSPEYRVRWTDAQAAELQAHLDELDRRRGLAGGPPPPRPASNPPTPSPEGSSASDEEAGAGDEFPSAHLLLLPNASVAEFRAGGRVHENGHPDERPLPGGEQTLFVHYGSAEAWQAITSISAIIILPHSRPLKFLVITSLRSPMLAFVVFTALTALVVWGFLSYEPAHRLLISLLRHATGLVKFIVYYFFHFCYLTIVAVVRALRSVHAAGRRAARYLLVAWLELAVEYLNQLRDAEALLEA